MQTRGWEWRCWLAWRDADLCGAIATLMAFSLKATQFYIDEVELLTIDLRSRSSISFRGFDCCGELRPVSARRDEYAERAAGRFTWLHLITL